MKWWPKLFNIKNVCLLPTSFLSNPVFTEYVLYAKHKSRLRRTKTKQHKHGLHSIIGFIA